MQISKVNKVSWECIHFVSDNPLSSFEKDLEQFGFQVFIIDGKSILNEQSLLENISAVLQFPDYFGKNWDALDECLCDLEWLLESSGYILMFHNSKALWNKNAGSFGKLVQSWLFAAEEWSKEKKPFHLIFAGME